MRSSIRISALAFVTALSMALATPSLAVQPDEILDDPALEGRARELSKNLRCVVCQSENIDESNVDLARDMRIRIRELLTEGRTDDEVMDFMVTRYGDFVLMRPPLKTTTLALWFGPIIVFGVGAVALGFYFRRRFVNTGAPAETTTELTDAERARLNFLLNEGQPLPTPDAKEPPVR